MTSPHRQRTPNRYTGRHRSPLLTPVVLTAVATATALGTGLTAASAAETHEEFPIAAESRPDPSESAEPSPAPSPTPDTDKPDTTAPPKPPSGNDAKKKKQKKPDWVLPSHDEVSDTYGPRGWRGGEMHSGLDFAAEQGDANFAAAAGEVVQVGYNGGYGLTVTIDNGNGVETLYAHHSSTAVDVGQHVDAGDTIGEAGSTGDITGPHLHFEVHVDGEPVDPMQFLRDKGVDL